MKVLRLIQVPFLMLFLCIVLFCCNKSDDNPPTPEPEDKQYAVWVFAGNPVGSYILPVNTLTQGKISPVGTGVDLTSMGTGATNAVIDKDGYFYFILNNKFSKAKIENNQLITENSIVISNISYISYTSYHVWDGDNLLMIERGKTANSQPIYVIVNVKEMKITSSGTLNIPVWKTNTVRDDNGKEVAVNILIRAVKIVGNNKIFVSWGYNKETGDMQSHSGFLDYPDMNNLTEIPPSDYTLSSVIFRNVAYTDDEENSYILKTKNEETRKYEYVKLKKGTTIIDSDYTFYLGVSRPTAICDLGNNLQLIELEKRIEKDSKVYLSYSLINIKEGKTVVDLNTIGLPLNPDMLVRKPMLSVDGKAYIAVSSLNEGSFIWEYDPVANKLTKGLEIEGGVTNIPYISRLK